MKKSYDKKREGCKNELLILLIMKRIRTTGYSPFAVFESFIVAVSIEGLSLEVFSEKFAFGVGVVFLVDSECFVRRVRRRRRRKNP